MSLCSLVPFAVWVNGHVYLIRHPEARHIQIVEGRIEAVDLGFVLLSTILGTWNLGTLCWLDS